MRALVTTAVLVAGLMAAIAVVPANAQSTGGERDFRRQRIERPRIRVTPNQRLVRQCDDWYVVEQRATGPTVVPNSRCWWAYR
jgi:hypothetical protein